MSSAITTEQDDYQRFKTLSTIAPRQGKSLAWYSHFVTALKVALPLAALAVVSLLIARFNEDRPNRPEISFSTQTTQGEIAVVKARYEGRDEQNRSYEITADKASKPLAKSDTVTFERPSAKLALEEGMFLTARSNGGQYDTKTNALALQDSVEIVYDGYTLYLDNVDIDVRQGTALSDATVRGKGLMGELEAAGLDITGKGDIVTLRGPATVTFYDGLKLK